MMKFINKFKNIEMSYMNDRTLAKFTMEDNNGVHYIVLHLNNSGYVKECSFEIGSHEQALMMVQSIEYFKKLHYANILD